MSNPLVSIIVPTYRRTDYLALTIRSLLDQTHSNLEVLVVSDGDDEETRRCVETANDSRARYLSVPHAGFPAAPRNEGLRQAKGSLLAFCDDDDLWHPEKLAAQIPILANDDYGMCTTEYVYVDQDGQLIDRANRYESYYGEIDWRTFYRSMGFICNAAVLFKREVYEAVGLQNELPELRAHEDFEYWMRVLFQFRGYFLDQPLVSYRVHQGSIQRASALRVWRDRRLLLRVLGQNHRIPHKDRLFKEAKLLAHFGLDAFPALRRFR